MMTRTLLDMITDLSTKGDIPVRRVCSALGIARSSFGRWKNRNRIGKPLVRCPGPRKMVSADIEAINRDVSKLDHGTYRSEGVTTLYNKYRETISRRNFADLVETARRDANRERRSSQRRIHWHGAGIAWAIDDTEHSRDGYIGSKSIINHIEDLGSKYHLEPIAGHSQPCGEEIAGHLDHLFHHHEPPLFLKRDNGGNLNHAAVNDVLAEYAVLPLNSPAYYPPYNGAIEQAQGELKDEIDSQILPAYGTQISLIEPYARAAVHELNHREKECLGNRTPCKVFHESRVKFTKLQRKEIYDRIKAQQDYIMEGGKDISPDAAWRLAAEVWLIQNQFITVSINNKVLPDFYKNLSHYL
jgi:hypothetical protein